jgi:N-acetylglucosamine-6-phosphate deacetylase
MDRITNVRLPQRPGRDDRPGLWWLELDDDRLILDLGRMPERGAMEGQNWRGDWLSPMGIDLQINGGLGLAFPELTEKDLPRLLQLLDQLWLDGVEAIAPTLVTCGIEPLREALSVLRTARTEEHPNRCRLLGAHLEGPFLAEARRGAHPLEHLCKPSLEALERRIKGFEHEIALVTLAPELKGAEPVIERLRSLGITVALGHSAANAKEAMAAYALGVGMLTHSFNAMPGLHHRAPGPLGAACRQGGIALGLIADGVHVDPTMTVLLQRLAGDQLVLVSDALAPYGLSEGRHRWDDRVLLVQDGSCRLEDGTLAGVTLPLLEGVRRLARWGGECEGAIWAATLAPRDVIAGPDADVGGWRSLLLHQPLANLLRWSIGPDGDLHWRHAA